MPNRGQDIPHPKLRGEWAELRFMQRATERGFRVAKPWGETAPYDVAEPALRERLRPKGPPRTLPPCPEPALRER
jgi:hypothetical protein